MIVSYISKGPAGYNPTTGMLIRVGNLEKVNGAIIGVGTSCQLRPQVMNCSGNVVTVKTFNYSGMHNAVSTILSSTDFCIFAEGI